MSEEKKSSGWGSKIVIFVGAAVVYAILKILLGRM
jgi:hypothetical protein